mmetsp:Transcript_14767/g.37673  ORF Transcript_14767/g.37673 Transcript_14767/m.37673 type:complete len:206 (+) Transcript_14767:256-873(+)
MLSRMTPDSVLAPMQIAFGTNCSPERSKTINSFANPLLSSPLHARKNPLHRSPCPLSSRPPCRPSPRSIPFSPHAASPQAPTLSKCRALTPLAAPCGAMLPSTRPSSLQSTPPAPRRASCASPRAARRTASAAFASGLACGIWVSAVRAGTVPLAQTEPAFAAIVVLIEGFEDLVPSAIDATYDDTEKLRLLLKLAQCIIMLSPY